jgi:hypothetical protein
MQRATMRLGEPSATLVGLVIVWILVIVVFVRAGESVLAAVVTLFVISPIILLLFWFFDRVLGQRDR